MIPIVVLSLVALFGHHTCPAAQPAPVSVKDRPAIVAMTPDDAIDALLQQKLQLEEHLPALLAACKTDAEAAALRSSYQHAVNQWNTAVNQKLVADEGLLGVPKVKCQDYWRGPANENGHWAWYCCPDPPRGYCAQPPD
ncbi:MAG: hypothetical protein ABSH46_08885 [Bryobacteraceae bacterium]|jgi:hypothetical protein